jgi:hypothetical protein
LALTNVVPQKVLLVTHEDAGFFSTTCVVKDWAALKYGSHRGFHRTYSEEYLAVLF